LIFRFRYKDLDPKNQCGVQKFIFSNQDFWVYVQVKVKHELEND